MSKIMFKVRGGGEGLPNTVTGTSISHRTVNDDEIEEAKVIQELDKRCKNVSDKSPDLLQNLYKAIDNKIPKTTSPKRILDASVLSNFQNKSNTRSRISNNTVFNKFIIDYRVIRSTKKVPPAIQLVDPDTSYMPEKIVNEIRKKLGFEPLPDRSSAGGKRPRKNSKKKST